MKVKLTSYPTEKDWMEVKRRALVTIGKKPVTPPDEAWKKSILEARHSPIRWLRFSFNLEVPYWLSVHLVRHVHSQPYVRTQRTDRTGVERDKLPQDEPVEMIWDMNAEELMVIANKRLCGQADAQNRLLVSIMCKQVLKVCPEFKDVLVPMCVYNGGVCHEMFPCGKAKQLYTAKVVEEAIDEQSNI